MPESPVRRILEGKPFRHPLHPMLVHFPIGLFVVSLVMDVASYFGAGDYALFRGSLYLLCAGVAMGLIAAVPGFVDWMDIRRDNPAKGVGQWHMGLNLLVLLVYGISIIARFSMTDPRRVGLPLIITSLAAIGLLSVSGYLGGMMVYDDGIGVGRHRRRAPAPSRTIALPSTAAGEGWVRIPGAEHMEDGQTLRLDVGGVIIGLARVGAAYYAFQDFCTHRHGPLSEGCFMGDQVMCPWHGSRFDLRTGHVTHGPAKKDIDVYEVRNVNGQVSVRMPEAKVLTAARHAPARGGAEERDWKVEPEDVASPTTERTPRTQ
ncbi:MAG TPA: DUF2231 domain-containing protein [Tepidisphaeraceae bacterium]|jgi:uncharacterized membrane protein/nitrite reductase/ring-hydroxylating ferredoxin subunit|nr:DUF2231 domain-containing protein [Tepidisphaeraceae bacterium]